MCCLVLPPKADNAGRIAYCRCMTEPVPFKAKSHDGLFRILSLDGGGAKGFYTLGILDEIEKNSGKPLCESFDLVFGTSTGAIIAALLARGDSVAASLELYRTHVPAIMRPMRSAERTAALHQLARDVFADTRVSDFRTLLGRGGLTN